MTDFDIRLQRLIDVAPRVAFDQWVDAHARRSWYAPDEGSRVVDSETDLRVGGSYRVSVVGLTGDLMYTEEGVFEVIEPPHRLVYQQIMRVPNRRAVETRVTVTFEERDGKTLLTLLDAGYATEEERDEFERGWPDFLDAYERSLASHG
jgi:uncharacterized protein YndB with AHSA1/START domain